jgi:hypothetical protein
MDCFLKKIFEGKKADELVHSQFMKFSRGEFTDKAMIRLKSSADKFVMDTTAEYARELVMNLAERLGNNKTLVTGALVSALDLEGFKYKEKKMAMGVRKYMIEMEMSGKEILELCTAQKKAFIAFSFKVGDSELIVQPKSPKSAKGASSPKKDDAEAKINFCKLKTSDWSLIQPFIFDSEAKGTKKVEIKHNFSIQDIIISPELKKEKDFAKIREMAERKGKIIRKLDVDGKKLEKQAEFVA